ncbi:MAG: macro domain-containing protein [Desulfovibrionales bacterium]
MKRLDWTIKGKHITLIKGDLTTADVDAVVNAANPQLQSGGGVDGALHKAAGPELLKAGQEHVNKMGNVMPGQAALTQGFQLPAAYVIHAVGPIWSGGEFNEDKILVSAHQKSLELADAKGLKTIAFPAVSCGSYGFPVDRAASVVLDFFRNSLSDFGVEHVFFYLHSEEDFRTWTDAAQNLFGSPEEN